MPTKDTHNHRPTISAGTPASTFSAAHTRTSGRTRSRVPENGNRSRTRFADRSRRRGRILIVLTAICVVELMFALLTSPVLNVKHTVVEGITDASVLSKGEIEITQRAGALPAGTNWLVAPVSSIQKRLTALPWVRSASIGRHLPTDIVVVVEPRVPAYSLITPAGRYEVAADSTPIRTLRREMENQLTPVVMLNSSDAPKPGTAFADIQARTAALVIHRMQSDTELRIAKIEIDQSTNIWLNMSSGVRVKFGHCEDVDAKIAMMRRLLSQGRASRFAEINVSCPESPAGKLRETVNHHVPAEVAAAPSSLHTHAIIHSDRKIPARSQSGVH